MIIGCLFAIVLSRISTTNAANILIYAPTLSYSHVAFNGRLADLLVKAGHRVVGYCMYFANLASHSRYCYSSKSIHLYRQMAVRMSMLLFVESMSICNRIVCCVQHYGRIRVCTLSFAYSCSTRMCIVDTISLQLILSSTIDRWSQIFFTGPFENSNPLHTNIVIKLIRVANILIDACRCESRSFSFISRLLLMCF